MMSFLDLYASYAAPVLRRDERAQNQRIEVERNLGRRESSVTPGASPLAPPYQIYPARVVPPDQERAA